MEGSPEPFWVGLTDLVHNFTDAQHLWQVPVLLSALAVGLGASAAVTRHKERFNDPGQAAQIRKIAFAAVTAVALALFERFFGNDRPAHLLNVAIALTVTLTAARGGVYLLKYTFGASSRVVRMEAAFVRLVWVVFALHITGMLTPLMDLLEDISFRLGGSHVTLLQILQGLLAIIVMLVLALWLGGVMERRIMKAEEVDPHLRVISVKLLRGVLVFLSVALALPMVGIDATFLSVIGGALGVGLGFGLQKIASNYVSGFIILMDRSVRLGDVITVEGRQGTVTKLEARCTVLAAGDGTQFMVPNETLLTQSVTNHTLRGQGVCRTLLVEVSFGNDLEKVRALMVAAASAQALVLRDPAPIALVNRFTGHGVELGLQFWIGDPGISDALLRSDLYTAIHAAFQASQVRLPLTDGVQSVTL